MGWIERDYPDASTLVAGVAETFEAACRAAIAARGSAFLALAGGRTPLPVYAHLANAQLGGHIEALPTDERCVPHDHPACNLGNLRKAFAGDANIGVQPLTAADGDIDASLAQARTLLAAHPEPFDAVLLGMGADGHFASLFPGAANLADGLAMDSGMDAIATLPDPLPPEAPFARISLTLPRLLRARAVHLVVSGQDKRAILRRVQQEPHAPYPVAALLHAPAPAPIHIHWSP
ncbi:6-phosphogluconolactonase [Thermomonas sp. LB-4]|uniref:6-phosphogluconolactonase n=1 Tax=Thermomonas sp. LB-4 TaxID=3102790 RepID=UPI002EDA41F6